MTILTATTRLLDILRLRFSLPANRFTKRHFRLTHVGFNLKLTQHPINDNLEMQLTHTGNNRLRRFLIRTNPERRILLRQFLERKSHLLLILLRLRLNRHRNHRLRELHHFQENRLLLFRQSISGRGTLQTDGRNNVTRIGNVDFFPFVGMHLEQPPDALSRSLCHIEHRRSSLQHSGIDTEKYHLPRKWVGHELEGKRRKRLAVRRFAQNLFIRIGINPLHRRNIKWRWQIIHNSIQ